MAASDYCTDVLTNPDIPNLIAERATDYVTDKMWARVTRDWSGQRCVTLAQLAREILEGRERLHEGLAEAASWLLGFFGRSLVERQFAYELVKRLPLPVIDEKLIAVGRGLQATGIVVCLARSRPMISCACFTDIVKSEGKTQVKELIVAATEDWVGLRRFGGYGVA
jgi:hypothetical protein